MFVNPFFLSPAAGLTDISGKSALKIMRDVGMNTGNMLFARALQMVLGPSGRPVVAGSLDHLKTARSAHDCIVVAAANWLQPRLDLGGHAAAIEETDLPCFVVGLGAQSGSLNRIPELPAGSQRFLSVISERSKSISVRGAFTADVLNHYGIQNVEVTGCPSLLMMGSCPPRIVKRDGSPQRISISGSRGIPSSGALDSPSPTHRLSRLFARLIQVEDVEFVAQAELPEILVLLDGVCSDDPTRVDWTDFASEYYGLQFEELASCIRNKMHVFFDVQMWLDYLASRDFVIGTRLHGTIAGLLAGTPSVLIVHDSRTREMANIMSIPSVEAHEIQHKIPYEEIYQSANFDNFNAGYMGYYSKFRDFFSRNQLTCSLM